MGRGEYEVLNTYESESKPGLMHEVRRGGDGVVYCTCPRWRLNQGRKSCRHLDEYLRGAQPQQVEVVWKPIEFHGLRAGDILECRTLAGRPMLIKFIETDEDEVIGTELLDEALGQEKTSTSGVVYVKKTNVCRVVSKGAI